MSSLPFWDPGAIVQGGTQLNAGNVNSIAPGIVSFLAADQPAAPWPVELSPFETVRLAGVRAPGLCRVEGGRRRRIDERFSPGSSGLTPSFMGYDPGRITILITIWTPMQWLALQNLIPLIQPAPSSRVQPKAVKVEHPGLQLLNIYDIYIQGISLPRVVQPQVLEFVIDAVEYLLPLNEGDQKIDKSVDVELGANGSFQPSASSARQLPADPSTTNTGP